jgi:hypothetical protein
MQLLTSYQNFSFSPQQINESIENNEGRLIVSGILQKWDEENANGRIYPKDILLREVEKYRQRIKENRATGELDHPDDPMISLSNVSHRVLDIWTKDNGVYGKVEVLNTPSGNILKELFKAGISLGISSRGLGSLKKINEKTTRVQEDFDLICWDFVSDPSTSGAFMRPLQEGRLMQFDKYAKMNMLIRDILSGE